MLNNITITGKHISGKTNLICDYLSHFKFQEFHQSKPQDMQPQSTTPLCLVWPISDIIPNIFQENALLLQKKKYLMNTGF